jgi:hypothetical protein
MCAGFLWPRDTDWWRPTIGSVMNLAKRLLKIIIKHRGRQTFHITRIHNITQKDKACSEPTVFPASLKTKKFSNRIAEALSHHQEETASSGKN